MILRSTPTPRVDALFVYSVPNATHPVKIVHSDAERVAVRNGSLMTVSAWVGLLALLAAVALLGAAIVQFSQAYLAVSLGLFALMFGAFGVLMREATKPETERGITFWGS